MSLSKALKARALACTAILATVLPPSSLAAADLSIRHVILYKHGIGFFERQGKLSNGEEARLDFKASDMNDILKSLIVRDSSGNRVLGIRYDSNETLQQRLGKFPFVVGDGQLLSAFLDGLKGAQIELKTADRPVTGTILSARAIQAGPEAERKVIREQITLVLESGEIMTSDLGAVTSVRLLEPRLQDQLKQYLQTVSEVRSLEKRSVYIDVPAASGRELHVQYITPAAIWKSSYRLSLAAGESSLEGWAIVDNTTDEDWNNVQLSVVSGRPISFISQLDTPRYGQRQVAELPEDRAAGPVVYGGSIDPAMKASAGVAEAGVVGGSGEAGGVMGGVARLAAPSPSPRQKFNRADGTTPLANESTVEGASGAQLGELLNITSLDPSP